MQKSLVIISFPRSGSTYFCSLLKQIRELQVYLELFHFDKEVVVQHMEGDWSRVESRLLERGYSGERLFPDYKEDPTIFLEELNRLNKEKSISYKVFPSHLSQSALEKCIAGNAVIFLYRNIVDSYISREIAKRTGMYANHDSSNEKITFDRNEFLSFGREVTTHFETAALLCDRNDIKPKLIKFNETLKDGFLASLVDGAQGLLARPLRLQEKASVLPVRQDRRENPADKVHNPEEMLAVLAELGLLETLGDFASGDVESLVSELRAIFGSSYRDIDLIPRTESGLRAFPVPRHIFLPRGMITTAEQTLFYLLAKYCFEDVGVIVDAGAFCGASAYAFCAGLEDNPNIFVKSRRVYSYDLFTVGNDYTRDYIQNNFYSHFDGQGRFVSKKVEINPGDSFQEVFEFQTRRYHDYIICNVGSILDQPWSGKAIEILFVDIAKTLEIQKHLFQNFLPALIPGRGILIQQDFHHPYHPYIHVAMEFLGPYFEITHSKVSGSRVYRLKEELPINVMTKVFNHDFAVTESLDLMRRCILNSDESEQPLLRICELRLMVECGRHEEARAAIGEYVVDYARRADFWPWLVPEMKKAVGELAIRELQDLQKT